MSRETAPYGPTRRLKKRRGRRAKAEIRRRALAMSSSNPSPGSARAFVRFARRTLATLGGDRGGVVRASGDPTTGLVTVAFRRTPKPLCVQVVEVTARDMVPAGVVLGWCVDDR